MSFVKEDKTVKKRLKGCIRLVVLGVLQFLPVVLWGQETSPFRGTFVSDEAHITIRLNPQEETIEVPGLGFLDKTHGYMAGTGVYGTWLVTSCKTEKKTLLLRLSNDMGSDSQTVHFRQLNDSVYEYSAVGPNAVRRAKGRRLVKADNVIHFRRLK